MKVINQLLILSAAIVVLGLGAQNAAAQPNGGGGNFGGGNFGGGNGNFDPQQMMQQMQQRQVDNIREQLEITNDTDWSAIEPLLSKVMQGSTTSMVGNLGGILGGLQGMFGNRGGGQGGQGGRGGQGRGIASLLGSQQPDPTADALKNAIDANAPTEQIKALLAKYREAQKRKADELAKNREDLRQVLTVRQEAILVSMGILD